MSLRYAGLIAALSACAAATSPEIRTENGEILISTGNGALLKLSNTEAIECPEAEDTGADDGAGFAEVTPHELPAHTSGTVSALSVGVDSVQRLEGTSRQFVCLFNRTDNGAFLGKVRGSVASAQGAVASGIHFYSVGCRVPAVTDMSPTTEVTLSLLHKDTPIPCAGAERSCNFKFVTKITEVTGEPGALVVRGSGFGAASPYACRLEKVGAEAHATPAAFISSTELRCNVTGAEHNRRHADFTFSVLTDGGEVVPQYHSEALTSTDSEGFQIPTAAPSVVLELDLCTDNFKNNLETDLDCGGGACPGCALGKVCVLDSDCADTRQNLCLDGICRVRDRDGDGVSSHDGDCDDANPNRFPGNVEQRNGIDDDCDGHGADGAFSWDKLRNNPNQFVWEFDSVDVDDRMSNDIPQLQPVTIFSLTNVDVRANINLNGGTGTGAVSAYTYQGSSGGNAAKTAMNRKGGTGARCCGPHSNDGDGPGGGGGGQYTSYGPGGGGAGHANTGGQGGSGSGSHARRGNAYGSASTPELNPGSGGGGGGAGSGYNQDGSGGGGAGGAIRFVANGTITIHGGNGIYVNGGSGGTPSCSRHGDGGAGGGGSGGTIVLEAPEVVINGQLHALGGSGGAGTRCGRSNRNGGRGSDGRIWVKTDSLSGGSGVQPSLQRFTGNPL